LRRADFFWGGDHFSQSVKGMGATLTYPNENTDRALTACATIPQPKMSTLQTQMIKSQTKYPKAND
jgi:hypothetical protein